MRRGERVRWGVLSASSTALTKAIPALQRCANATVAALGSRDLEKARRHASSLGIGRAHGSYEALLDDPEIDAVYVSVPNALHAKWTCRAAAAGKHVLCEKPAALNGGEATMILAACAQNGVLFMEGLKHRFHPQIALVRQRLAEGRLGEVRLLRVSFSFILEEHHSKIRLQRALGGGALADLGIYAIDLASHLLNARPVRVFASGSRRLGADVETDFAAVLEFPGGCRALLDGAFDQPRQNSCTVVGQRGVIEITSPFLPGESAVHVHLPGERTEQTFPAADLFQMEFEHFSTCIADAQPPGIPGEDTLANAEILAVLQRSLATGEAIFPFRRDEQAPRPAGTVTMSTRSDPECVCYISSSHRFPDRPRTPIHREPGTLRFLVLKQPTLNGRDTILTVPDALGINGDTQIGLARANRIMPPGIVGAPVQSSGPDPCSVCDDFKDLPMSLMTVARDNPRPFGPLLHKVVFSREHIVRLDKVTRTVVRDSWERFYEIATSPPPHLDGLTIGLNFGEYVKSGASQPHFHYQVAGLSQNNYNAGDLLGNLCRAYRERFSAADYLTDYERLLRDAGLIIAENEHALTYSPISPRFKGEVQIMVKDPGIGNIVDTTEAIRDSLAELEHQAMLIFGKLGCTALNEVWYMTRFSQKNVYGQRLIISMAPRTAILAFYELSGNYVIDLLPWVAAETLRGKGTPCFSL